ncbi:MAG: ATPase, partial [Muribaculaceae bacterium]|nr:ATPase [Muribaculaceae bacterium]
VEAIHAVVSRNEITEVQKIVNMIYVDEKIENYIVDLVFATREPAKYGLNDLEDLIEYGASPRASISLAKAARAYAFLQGRGYVIPEDVRAVCHDVMRHRIGLSYEAEANNINSDEVITTILDKVQVP